MARKKNRRLRFVISSILSFLLAMVFTLATVLVAVKIGFLSENSVLAGMNKKNYYKSAEEDFYQDARDFTIPVGLPASVVENIVDFETIYNDIQGYVKAAVNEGMYTFDTDDLQSRLTENVYAYFRDEGMDMTEEQITTVPEYTQMIADIYVENVKVNYVTLLGKINTIYGNYMGIGIGVCLVLAVVILIMLVKLHRWKHRAVRFVTYSAITTSVFVITPAVAVWILEKFMKPNIAPEHLYYALVNYCASGLRIFLYFAIAWMGVVAALLLLIRYLKKKAAGE